MNSTEGPISCSSSSSTSSSCVPSPISPMPVLFTPRQLSDAYKLRKVICELVDTERTYVKVSIFCCVFQACCSAILMLDLSMIKHFCFSPECSHRINISAHENRFWLVRAALKPNMKKSVSLQDLNILIERYLNPLQKESFLSQDEVKQYFMNVNYYYKNSFLYVYE